MKLADFGLSIDATEERPVTRAGTLDYMAPEVRPVLIKEKRGGICKTGLIGCALQPAAEERHITCAAALNCLAPEVSSCLVWLLMVLLGQKS